MKGDLAGGDLADSKSSHGKKTWQRQLHRYKKRVPITLRSIRLIQLILDIVLCFIAISLLTRLENPVGTAAAIILIALFASFAIVISIDAVGRIRGLLTPDFPMIAVSLLGLILFTLAAQAVYLLVYSPVKNGSDYLTLVLIALCVVAAFLFLLDAMIMIVYWRYIDTKYGKCKPCRSGRSLTILYQKPTQEKASEILVAKNNVSTSFSEEKQRSSNSGFFGYRSNNRIGVGPRRQYVDCPTNVQSNTSVKLAETQTTAIDPVKSFDHEISAIAVVEEKSAQTLSQCPICSARLDYTPEGICPTFLAMVQSFGMLSCAESPQVKSEAPVLVERGTLPGSNSSLKAGESTVLVTKKAPRVYETRPCPTHGAGLVAQKAGLPSPVTRISLIHSIRKNKRTQTPSIKPIAITDKFQNTEVNAVEETTNTENSQISPDGSNEEENLKKVDIPTEEKNENNENNSPKLESSFNGQESIEKLKVQTREIGVAKNIEDDNVVVKKESVYTEKSMLSLKVLTSFNRSDSLDYEENSISQKVIYSTASCTEASSMKQYGSGKFQATTRGSGPLGKIEEGSSTLESSFSLRRNSDQVSVPSRDTSTFEKTEGSTEGSRKESLSNREHLPSRVPSGFVKRDTLTSYFAGVTSPFESTVRSAEISKRLSESKELANPSLPCKCSRYYYKDVFGRYICNLCAHKYLIKIPQRYTSVKPVGDIRCCSCAQAIFHQAPNAGHTRCQKCRRCKYQMYAGSRK